MKAGGLAWDNSRRPSAVTATGVLRERMTVSPTVGVPDHRTPSRTLLQTLCGQIFSAWWHLAERERTPQDFDFVRCRIREPALQSLDRLWAYPQSQSGPRSPSFSVRRPRTCDICTKTSSLPGTRKKPNPLSFHVTTTPSILTALQEVHWIPSPRPSATASSPVTRTYLIRGFP
jgi:hypothetical protein